AGSSPAVESSPASAAKSNDSASAWCSRRRSPKRWRRSAARSRSISTASIEPTRASSGAVSAAVPGPISTRRSPGRGSIAATIAATAPRSTRKCWPKRLRGRTVNPESGGPAPCAGRAPRRRSIVQAVLHVRPVADLPQPLVVRLVRLLLAQRLARGGAHLLRGVLHGPAGDHLDEMHAELRAHRVADAALG